MIGLVHVITAILTLSVGLAVLIGRKGGIRHRRLGFVYAGGLLLVNMSALASYPKGHPGAFHVLAIISLATLMCGFIPAVLRRPREHWTNLHARFMSWSYVGLAAAGVAQLATRYELLLQPFAVIVPTLAIVVVGAFWIHSLVPKALAKLDSAER